ncbi:hypothetical protein [Spirosoma koreense]
MESTNQSTTGNSTYEPAVEFALVKLQAQDSPDTVRSVTKERFTLSDAAIEEVMNLATSQYEQKEKNF